MLDMNVLQIEGVPVSLRPLPSGDLAVWHPCNERVRARVEPICRDRGRWETRYNNWIIFRQFRAQVVHELCAEADDAWPAGMPRQCSIESGLTCLVRGGRG